MRRIFTTTHQQDSDGSTSNTTSASFDGLSSIITHVQSRWIVVDESPAGEASDHPETKESSQVEGIEGAEDIPANDNGETTPIHRTSYQFDNCHVFINSFNAHGVRVNNSGNYAPRVSHHGHGGTAPNEGSSQSSSSQPELSIHLSTQSELREDGSSYASDDSPNDSAPPIGIDVPFPTFEPDSTFGSPPTLLFQLREDSSSFASVGSPSAPSVGTDLPFPTFEQQQLTRDELPATVDAKLMQSNSAPITLPGPESQPHPVNPFLPIHMGLHPSLLSHILQPFPNDATNNNNTTNDWNNDLPSSSSTNLHHYSPHHKYPSTSNHSSPHHRLDINSNNSLEHHLDSALAILIQTSGILADGVTPQARNALKAINSLVSMETPSYDDPPPPFKSVRKVVKWLQIPRSPK